MLTRLDRPRFRSWLALLAALLLGLAATSCSLQQLTVRQTAAVFSKGKVALDRESNPAFARKALPANIKTLESLLVNAPNNEDLLALLAESYYSYAFGYLEMDLTRAKTTGASEATIEETADRTVEFYMRARDYGFRLLDKPEFRKAATKPNVDEVRKQLEQMGQSDVPGLFWIGFSWGSAVNLAQQDPDMAAKLPVVEAIMQRVVELDDTFYDSGPHLFLGILNASKPKIAGGDPEKAKQHFEEAMEQHGERNLMIPVLYARYYGAQTQSRDLFDSLTKRVMDADLTKHPKRRLKNELARRRARFWREHADELFY